MRRLLNFRAQRRQTLRRNGRTHQLLPDLDKVIQSSPSDTHTNATKSLCTRLLLLVPEQGEQGDTGNFDDLESDTWQITY